MTGLFLQLAIGPVFFYIMNLVIQRSFLDGMAGVLAVTLVDFFYIALAIFGVGALLENAKFKKIFGTISSIALICFGLLIFKDVIQSGFHNSIQIHSSNILSSFASVFLLAISNPLTIVFFTSLFTAKAIEYGYADQDIRIFGLGTGTATLIFMGMSALVFSLLRQDIPTFVILTLNLIVGLLLVGYGGLRLTKAYVRS